MEELKDLVMELEELAHKAKKMLKKQGMGQRNNGGYNGGSGYGNRRMGYREDWEDWDGGRSFDPRFMD
jgi:hypothetical protein